MKKVLLTGLLALSNVFVHAGLMPEQIKAAKEVQQGFVQEITDLKKEYAPVFKGAISDDQKFDAQLAELTNLVSLHFVYTAGHINSILNNKKSKSVEDIFIGLIQLYTSAVALNTRESNSNDLWITSEALVLFEQLSKDHPPKDSDDVFKLIVLSEYSVALKNAGIQENSNQVTQQQLGSAIAEVVQFISDGLYSRLVATVAKNAGKTEITKQEKVAALQMFVNFFQSCVKDASFEQSQPVAETKSAETKKATANKTTAETKKTAARKKK